MVRYNGVMTVTCEKTKLKYFWTFKQLNNWTLFKCSFEHLNKWTWTIFFVQMFIWTFEQMNMNKVFFERVRNKWTWTNFFRTCSEQINMNKLFLSVFRTNEHEHAYFWTCSEQMNMNTLFLNVFSAHPWLYALSNCQ